MYGLKKIMCRCLLFTLQTWVRRLEVIRSAIEDFESVFGKYADVEFPTHQEEKNVHERKRVFRERLWNWIFENKKDKHRVRTLIDKINATATFASTGEFASLISEAHDELSEYVDHELLRPGSISLGDKTPVSHDPHINSVIELFMHVFAATDVAKKENS